jgi:mono/diheme cytochrome c family protein
MRTSLLSSALLAGSVLGACSSVAPSYTPARAPAELTVDAMVSDPAEYRIERPSEEAGQDIFSKTGIGDPYRTGLPYPLFLALLELHPELLGATPAEMADRFGFTARAADKSSANRDVREGLPLGLHLTDDPNTRVPFVVHNCALCHSEVVRWPGGEKVVVGLGNRRIRIHAFEDALAKIAMMPDFDRAHLAPVATRIAQERDIPWSPDQRGAVLTNAMRVMKERFTERAPFLGRTRDALPGRVATIEAFATALGQLLHRKVTTPEVTGWAKIPDTIGFGVKRTLSWDGGSEGPSDALVVDADIAAGARIEWLYSHPLQGASLSTFLRHMPRDLRFPGPIDATLAQRGKATFEGRCAKCHGTYEDDGRAKSYTEKIVPVALVGTDSARADAVTDDFLAAANDPKLVMGGLALVHTRRTSGYVPPVLTSIWARAPYGHAGQWPTLSVLATKPSERPTRFVVHGDAPLDLTKIGVEIADANATLGPGDYVQDAAAAGFSVAGHPFLADLAEDERGAVIEYLKTL